MDNIAVVVLDSIVQELKDPWASQKLFQVPNRIFHVSTCRVTYNCPYCSGLQIFLIAEQTIEILETDLIDKQFQIELERDRKCCNCGNSNNILEVIDVYDWKVFIYILNAVMTYIGEEEGSKQFKISCINRRFTCEHCGRESWHTLPEMLLSVPVDMEELECTHIVQCPTCAYTQEVLIKLNSCKGIEIGV